MAPIIYASSLGNPRRANKLVRQFEKHVQQVVSFNCQRYIDQVSRPGAFERTWERAIGPAPSGVYEDTPAKRYLSEYQEGCGRAGSPGGSKAPLQAPSVGELSPREREVLQLLVAGKTNGEIAAVLGIRQNTVKNHVAHIFDKYNVNTRAELIARVLRRSAL